MNKRIIVEGKELSKLYTMGGGEVKAVHCVNIAIAQGEFVSIMGPSGSGKTTLLNLLGCLDYPSGGTLFFEEQDVSRLAEVERDHLRLKRIGFVFQAFNLIPTLTAMENVMFPLEIAEIPPKKQEERATELLSWVGLAQRMHHRPRQLSAGESQRVGIARALANSPMVLLADEPTGNLDSKTALEIVSLFQRINTEQGTAIVLVTHNPRIAEAASRCLSMKDGQFL